MLIKFNYQPDIKMKFQFRNYIRAVVNAFVIGHVTPFLYKQPCFECIEVFFYLTFLPCNIVLNAKPWPTRNNLSKWLHPIISVGFKSVNMEIFVFSAIIAHRHGYPGTRPLKPMHTRSY